MNLCISLIYLRTAECIMALVSAFNAVSAFNIELVLVLNVVELYESHDLSSRSIFFSTFNNNRVRGCRFVQFCKYFYHIFLTSEGYRFICHCQPNAQ